MSSAEPLAARRQRRKLTPVGASWYRGLYGPEMRMPEPNITALLFFDQPPSLQALGDEFEQHIWPLYRFSSVVVDGSFVPVPGPMDRSFHFREQEVADEAEVRSLAESAMVKPMDRTRPLWQATLFRARTGRSAFMVRMHHTISDGLGCLFAFLPILKTEDGDTLSKIPLPAAVLPAARRVRAASAGAPRPQAAAGAKPGWFASIRMFLRGVLSILVMKEDADIAMNGPIAERRPFLKFSGRHVYTRMPLVPTSAIKAVRAAHGCTFNDAIMAALAGAFRRYSIENLQDPKVAEGGDVECKAFMLLGLPRPVDPNDASVSLANKFLTPVFKLPIGEASPAGRLGAAVRACNDLKSKAYLMGINLTTQLVAKIAPVSLMRKVTANAISKCTCNVSNMPFPDEPVKLANKEVQEFQVLFVNNIPQITMVSYNGHLQWNMVSDPACIAEPEAIGKYFLEEFAALAGKA